ncbi:hypothetical protein [Thalassorhabdomicrobium marinisediminis]|uniref:hypothetical protein n=1 Tax=Thalassorhabdomicrobium marinisediminis TaxID=2170577 RepID=UPI002490D1F4|nr:hypothetical protein [Thalassorhabdomicrobium marinisediminis]
MTRPDIDADVASLRTLISATFGEDVIRIGMPGGEKRPVYRVHTPNRSVIVARRVDSTGLRHERAALAKLATAGCDRVPEVLHEQGDLTVIRDLGRRRLNVVLHQRGAEAAAELLRDALRALVDIHTCAARVEWGDLLAPITATRKEIRHFARGPERLARLYGLPVPKVEVDALQAVLTVDTPRMVKWDCRSANAALDDADRIGWFDFEHCGLRGGYEDFGWLIADEALPMEVAPIYDSLRPILRDAALSDDPAKQEDYIKRFEIFTCLHASLRLRVIRNELKKKSWTPAHRILRYDLVGADPHMAARVARTGGFLARRHRETRSFAPLFQEVEQIFVRALSLPRTPPGV